MTKFQNVFVSGILDKDNNRRIVASDALLDAENFIVITTENSNRGVGRNVPGNKLLTTNGYTLPETLGSRSNSTNEKVYYFVKTSTFDYILEYSYLTQINTVVLQSTTNTRLNFQTGKRIINIDIIYSGEPYDSITGLGGDLIAWSGDNNPPRIGNIERMKTWGIDGFTAEEIMLIKAPPLAPPLIDLVNTISEAENFIKNKLISFATRFKYKDGYYSAISTWQEYAFAPKVFDLDFNSKQNKGMINSVNSINIKFNTGPREVIAIDLLYKYSNSSTVYKVDQFIKTEEGWTDNIVIPTPIVFDNGKTYQILPESQYFRSFDNVPEVVYAQTMIGSRIAYANYLEGKNMIDHLGNKVKMTYTVGLNSISNTVYTPVISSLNSISPFDASVIIKGKIRIDFTGVSLNKDNGMILGFNLVTLPVVPPITPSRPTDQFQGQYLFLIPSDYANVTDLVNDTANGFKTGLEGYFSQTIKNEIILPANSYPFPPIAPPNSIFNGLQISVISTNVIEINLPTMRYEVQQITPPGPNFFVNEYYTELLSEAKVETIGTKKSMKSYRSYEIAMIHRDAQGRKTTATVSENNTVFIPISDSTKRNIITVDLSTQKPPAWATTYKFAIKENRVRHEEIYITQFFEDGYFRWAKIDGENINKVKLGDLLLVKHDAFNVMSVPITTPILELKNQPEDFLSGAGVEPAGLYMKINPIGFQMPVDPDSYTEYNFSANAKSGPPTVVCKMNIPPSLTKSIPNGSIFTIKINSSKGGTNSEDNSFEKVITANATYADFKTFFDVQINPIPFQGNNTGTLNGGEFIKTGTVDVNGEYINITGTSQGSPTIINPNRAFISVNITLRTTSGMLIFETLGEEINDGIFYETPDVFAIVNGEYIENGVDLATQLDVVNWVHYLEKTFNCYVQGNGAESYQILDAWNAKYLSIDFSPTAVSENEYKQINRFADITYSEPYNTNTSINKLNEFNLSLANFKDDIEKSYGPIIKIAGLDANLEVFQEEKDSRVYYGKDLLYNADGTTNLTGIPQVLGIQDPYLGEYGISFHPESYTRFGFNTYHTDVKRGVVLKKSNNGLFEISSQGMTNYFHHLFRDNIILNIIGEYDQYNEQYILNIKYIENAVTKYVTWCYSDRYNGWNTRHTFNPEDMCRLNNNLLSFNQGELYVHNQPFIGTTPNYNTFYGVVYPSAFEFVFSQNPSDRKMFSTLEIEGTIPLEIITKTDLNEGYINTASFDKKEGIFYSYIRNSNNTIDTSLLSCQGIGNATVLGLTLAFSFPLDPIISVGDQIINLSKQVVGTVLSKTEDTLVLNTMLNIVSGDYVICAKTQSIAVNSMLGYYMNVKANFNETSEQELFAINSEVTKSYM
jgi:hypothetical protein